MNVRNVWRSLAHRNFRLFFVGQGISLIGTWMQQVALAWVVYLKTDSPWWLGIVGFAGQIPSFFFAPIAGVVADHTNRHRLLLVTQTLSMLQAFLIAYLTITEVLEVWHILSLSFFVGVVNAFDMPARQAFLGEIVPDRDDLANAVALNSSLVNGARLVGPALAGLLLAQTSPAVCFLANAVSYLAVLAALLGMRVERHAALRSSAHWLERLREGFRYAFGFAPIRSLLILLSLVSMLGMSYTVLFPVFATQILGGGAQTLGLLTAATGIGAFSAAVMLAARASVLGLGKWIGISPGAFGLGLVAFSLSESLPLSLAVLVLNGFFMMLHMAASNTVLQTIVDEDKRGRVMSFYAMAFLGVAPIGSLLAGFIADRLGAPVAVRLAGMFLMLGSVWFLWSLPAIRTLVRPIYIERGILEEELAAAVQTASELTRPPEGR